MRTALPLILTAAVALRAASVCGSPAPQDAAKNVQPSPALSGATAKPEATPVLKEIKLPAGTRVELEMAHTIDSMTTRTGDAVSLRVVNPVVVEGATVIAQGATATARVVKAARNGHWGRAGRIVWELTEVTAVDGSRVALASSGRAVGDSKGAKVATQTVLLGLGLGVAAPAALLTGFKRGENAVVPEGKRFDAVTRAEAVVNAPARR